MIQDQPLLGPGYAMAYLAVGVSTPLAFTVVGALKSLPRSYYLVVVRRTPEEREIRDAAYFEYLQRVREGADSNDASHWDDDRKMAVQLLQEEVIAFALVEKAAQNTGVVRSLWVYNGNRRCDVGTALVKGLTALVNSARFPLVRIHYFMPPSEIEGTLRNWHFEKNNVVPDLYTYVK